VNGAIAYLLYARDDDVPIDLTRVGPAGPRMLILRHGLDQWWVLPQKAPTLARLARCAPSGPRNESETLACDASRRAPARPTDLAERPLPRQDQPISIRPLSSLGTLLPSVPCSVASGSRLSRSPSPHPWS